MKSSARLTRKNKERILAAQFVHNQTFFKMKTTLALALLAATLYACQNDQKVSEVEQKRLELEAKRNELKEKKELVALDEEMKNVEAEMEKVDGVSKPKSASSGRGRIVGDNVIVRYANTVQSAKMGVFFSGEIVTILQKQSPGASNEAIINQDVTLTEAGFTFTLPKGKAVVMRQNNWRNNTYEIIIQHPEKGEIYAIIDGKFLDKTNGELWYRVRRGSGEEGWVFGKFLEEI